MRPTGLAAVEAAKADGRWERAYAGPATMTVPDDFAAALANNAAAAASFELLNKSERYSVLWRIQTSSPTARGKKIETLVASLAKGDQSATSKPSSKTSIKRTGEDTLGKNTIEKPDKRPRRYGLRSSSSG